MSLTPGTRLGPYEIVSAIGAGGMGEVYRATDTNLKRPVAIKVLPASVAGDADRLARFQREAEALAALNHPNIAAIYGIVDLPAEAGSHRALIMELVEGDDLSLRIARGAIPVDEALPIAKQIADALEAAHEQGIIHRDLKPANIKVRDDGTVKVLDFGLAKAMNTASVADASAMNSPTLSVHATMQGIILGSAAYMAPEQARGKAVDKRADIWAFGVVLFEMLTGTRAFGGEDTSDVLAAVLRQDVDWAALPASTPPRVRRLLGRCLDRDLKQRLRDIGEARVEIVGIQGGSPDAASAAGPVVPPRRTSREVVAWGVASAAVIAMIAMPNLRPPEPLRTGAPAARLPFVPPANVMPTDLGAAIISPNGQTLVFSGRSASDGRRMLWARPLDSLEAQPLPDTEDALEPFWSPDSRSIGFGAQGKLKRVDLAGGRAQTLTDAGRLNGGAWSPSGVIVFSPDYRMPLYRVQSTGGGQRVPVTPSNVEARYPVFLPDGRHFLYSGSSNGTTTGTFVGSVDSLESKLLLPGAAPAVYARPGSVLYNRNGMLVAHAFNADRLELTGEPQPVAAGPAAQNVVTGGRFSVSDNGVLVMQDAPTFDYQLTWFDRSGRNVGTLGPVLRVRTAQVPRLSADGKRVAIQRFDPQRTQELWIGDVTHDTFDPLTTFYAQLPIWSPDSRSVIIAAAPGGVAGIYRMPAAGGDAQLLLTGTAFPSDESRDGRWLFYMQRGEKTRMDIWALPLGDGTPPAAGRAPRALVNSEFDEQEPQVSPDGRWLAYTSDVGGRFEVYVRGLAADGTAGEATRVSSSGGMNPCWGRDGRELFYVTQSNGPSNPQLVAVAVKASRTSFEFGATVPMFKVPLISRLTSLRDYDVSLDSQRFLVGAVVNQANVTPITIVLNWWASLKK